jgi:hypothetical protein
MDPLIQSARVQYLLGTGESQCGRPDEAAAHFRAAADSISPAEIVWARRAAHMLPGYDDSTWQPRLEAALAGIEGEIETRSLKGIWIYAAGVIERELGRQEAARSRP